MQSIVANSNQIWLLAAPTEETTSRVWFSSIMVMLED